MDTAEREYYAQVQTHGNDDFVAPDLPAYDDPALKLAAERDELRARMVRVRKAIRAEQRNASGAYYGDNNTLQSLYRDMGGQA